MVLAPIPTEIYFVRHAEVDNPRDILYGRLPRFRLSPHGREQAARTARFLEGRPIAAIYTSPLLRARQTARILSRRTPDLPVHRSSLLTEVLTGYQGSPNAIMKPGFSFYDPPKRPGDESMSDVLSRFRRFLRMVVRRHAGEAVVAVSHADPIAILRLGLTGQALTTPNLHSTVYPARASVNHVIIWPRAEPDLLYLNVAGERLQGHAGSSIRL